MKIYQAIATALAAKLNCETSGNEEWRSIWADRIRTICSDQMPSGSGVDTGTEFDWDESKPERLVFIASCHHMTEIGYYDGWTDHQIIVTPSLLFGYSIRVTGRNRNDIKDYLGDLFHAALGEELGEWAA